MSIKAIRFISIALLPAPKRDVLAYLDIPLKTGEKPEEKKEIVRKAEVDVSSISSITCLAFVLIYLNRLRIVYRSPGRVCACPCLPSSRLAAYTDNASTPFLYDRRHSYNAVLSLKEDTWTVDSLEKLGDGVQPQISVEELLQCEEIIRKDERVIKLAKEVGRYLLFWFWD